MICQPKHNGSTLAEQARPRCGVTEAQNEQGEDFEEERLMEILQKNESSSAEVMKDEILSGVKEFTGEVPQSDDITLLILKAK